MNSVRDCGCKGYRSCLLCEIQYNISEKDVIKKDEKSYVYCIECNKAWIGWSINESMHPNHSGEPINFSGVYIQPDFISEDEENEIMKGIDEMSWDLSQSGRRKQNFGPKTNFKKKKLKIGNFKGFPLFSKFVQKKFKELPLLKNYQTIEQCSLEYDPNRGASIDPHIDDCWIWGERIITVNCLSDSVLTMTPYLGDKNKYNLNECSKYSRVVDENGTFIEEENTNFPIDLSKEICKDIIVRIPMPRRSIIILYGEARYNWEHCVYREDITDRRVCLAYREFTPNYLSGGDKENEAVDIFNAAESFWDHNIN